MTGAENDYYCGFVHLASSVGGNALAKQMFIPWSHMVTRKQSDHSTSL